MEWAHLFGKTAAHIRDNIRMEKNKERENTHLHQRNITRGIGWLDNKMDEVNCQKAMGQS